MKFSQDFEFVSSMNFRKDLKNLNRARKYNVKTHNTLCTMEKLIMYNGKRDLKRKNLTTGVYAQNYGI